MVFSGFVNDIGFASSASLYRDTRVFDREDFLGQLGTLFIFLLLLLLVVYFITYN